MTSFIDPKTLKTWLHDSREIALLDVREHGQYGEAHLFYGIPLPFSRLEVDAPRLVPRRDVRVVVYDEGDTDVAERAARQLAALGYTDVHVLQGGARAWKAAGHVLFAGVNLPSKTFGELAEEAYHTPRVSADQLAEMLARKDKVVVLDGRPVSEFHKMNIPGATCCPNGELAYRVRQLAAPAASSARRRSSTWACPILSMRWRTARRAGISATMRWSTAARAATPTTAATPICAPPPRHWLPASTCPP